ncbi:hypothetical protein FC426_15220 [Bordetella pertussis]|nr:hypothetical protein [Bordetella pertussis]WAZ50024.1 hypothetical protein FC426_15220 [Bordetella pertussis]
MSELGGGDFQFLKSGSDEPCIQPIESSQLAYFVKQTGGFSRDSNRTMTVAYD